MSEKDKEKEESGKIIKLFGDEGSERSDPFSDNETGETSSDPSIPQSKYPMPQKGGLRGWNRLIVDEIKNRQREAQMETPPEQYERKTGLWFYDHRYYDPCHMERIHHDLRNIKMGLDQVRGGLDFIWGRGERPKIVRRGGESQISDQSLASRVRLYVEVWNDRREYDYVAEDNWGTEFVPERMDPGWVDNGEKRLKKDRWERWLVELKDESVWVVMGVWLDDTILGKMPPSVEARHDFLRRFEERENEPEERKLARAEEVRKQELLKLEEGRSIRDSVLGGRNSVREKGLGGYVDVWDPTEITEWDLRFCDGVMYAWKDLMTLKKWKSPLTVKELFQTLSRAYSMITMDFIAQLRWEKDKRGEKHEGEDLEYYNVLEEELEEQRKFEEELDREEARLNRELAKGIEEERRRREREKEKGKDR